MKAGHVLVAVVGQVIVLCIAAFILVYMPVSAKIIEVDFENVDARIDGYSKYGLEPDDLKYLKAIGKSLAEGYELNKTNLALLRSLTKYYFALIFVSLFLIAYFSVLFFKDRWKGTTNIRA